jgi:predicted metalloprotease with PDZ domain
MSFRKILRWSKILQPTSRSAISGLPRLAATLFILFIAFNQAVAGEQSMRVNIGLLSAEPGRVKVEGQLNQRGQKRWSFINTYAGVTGLGERIENLQLANARGEAIQVRKLAPGIYEAAGEATHFSYEAKLDIPANLNSLSHVSWLAATYGFLMLGDLLPQVSLKDHQNSVGVRLSFPAQWSVASSEMPGADGEFETDDAERALFFVGQRLRTKRVRAGSMEILFAATGEWSFTDDDASSLASTVVKDYLELFGGAPRKQGMVMLAPFPASVDGSRWNAETRGAAVVLLSGRSPSKIAALAQLSVPLTHELLHLWVPNGLALDGDYDWFYEGFTNYQAMRTGMRLNHLTFQDYLNALGRAFDGYLSATDRNELSLVEISRRRWSSSTGLVYQKGMLVAFLYDLQLRMQTRSKRSLDDVYQELFRLYHQPEKRADGNTAILAALNAFGEMRAFTRQYIETAGAIDLAAVVAPFGLRVERDVRTRVFVAASLTNSQRDLLRKFGYNDKVENIRRRAS